MNCIFHSKIGEFVEQDSNELLNVLRENFKLVYGEYPGIEQIMAWESSVVYMQEGLNNNELHNHTIAFEYRLPFSNERIDLLIFGKDKMDKPKVIVFELKGWKWAKQSGSDFIVECDIGTTIHPEYQVENYTGKIRFSHSEANEFEITPAILMYNGDPSNISLKFEKVKTFYKDDIQSLRSFINQELPNPLDDFNINKFLKGDYIQSKKLFDAIKKHFKEIKTQSYLTLAENGWGLSTEQIELIEEIISDLKNKNKVAYFIQGSPGSGKTLVAIHLLLSTLTKEYQVVLAYRNNRLINSIRNIFDSIERGLSNPIKFYSVGPRAGFRGVAEPNFQGPSLDLVIYDEAQRMTKENIKYALQRGKITVFFYDEGQILNAEEEGYTMNFINEANMQGLTIKQRNLKGFYRVEGGSLYHKFVEDLLKVPGKISQNIITLWKHNYEFKVFNNIEDFIKALSEKREQKYKVATIAAFTESPGDSKDGTSIKNLRIGYPLYSGFELYKNFCKKIYWLMDPENDYVPFWVKGESNKLEKCASIYGCQGFETDFAGVIWGRDFVYREGKWELGENCEDNIGKPSLKQLIAKAKDGDVEAKQLALNLLINRYRIFLTRGIKGTYIFCEDKETDQFLRNIYENFLV
jgi:DUF2075 family protein